MNITIERSPGGRIGPDIVDVLLVDKSAGTARALSLINHNDSSRKTITGNGPRNTLMFPTKLTETIKRSSRYRGILTMYTRSYNRDENKYTIDSAMKIEAKIPDTRPEDK